ncbi:ribosome small subunit-dependent GTPase A [Bacillus aquiflavi]|uniref:ribosome small subunit-dependent GTPase A n=1 Tax=Bacillus aquiflavi TaxID=2672567 RepID=UPI001CA96DC4|nr:ribosome small subunit-dependent GTPase A [Bacillus aquiflavi]UAC49350.1 ribosome small subunit-dependent GTPase A [Bacillus aquiflavi]
MPEGKIIKAVSVFYYVLSENGVFQCKGRGVFRKKKLTPLVGDYVVFQAEKDNEGYILEVKERKNELIRPPIANVDQAVLIFSAVEPEFSTTLLDRFLVLIEANNIHPLICITKMDITNREQAEIIQRYKNDYSRIGYKVLLISTKTTDGINELLPYLNGKISVFAGQSGVGKSSLLNMINPELNLKTAQISTHLGRGKHTTRHVELMEIGNGFVADTPGFSSLEFTGIEAQQLATFFPEINNIGEGCKFRGCFHLKEPHCAVKAAVENKVIPEYRYKNYKNFLQEIKERKPRY